MSKLYPTPYIPIRGCSSANFAQEVRLCPKTTMSFTDVVTTVHALPAAISKTIKVFIEKCYNKVYVVLAKVGLTLKGFQQTMALI